MLVLLHLRRLLDSLEPSGRHGGLLLRRTTVELEVGTLGDSSPELVLHGSISTFNILLFKHNKIR